MYEYYSDLSLQDRITLAAFRDHILKLCNNMPPGIKKPSKSERENLRIKCKNKTLDFSSGSFKNLKLQLNSIRTLLFSKKEYDEPAFLNEYLSPEEQKHKWSDLLKEAKSSVKPQPLVPVTRNVSSKKMYTRMSTAYITAESGINLSDGWGWSKGRKQKSISKDLVTKTGKVTVVAKLKPLVFKDELSKIQILCNEQIDTYKTQVGEEDGNLVVKVNGGKKVIFYTKPIIEPTKDGHHLHYNCGANSKFASTTNKRVSTFDKSYYDYIYDCEATINSKPTNEEIYKQTLQKAVDSTKDIFLVAYGQSGSGKSYLIMGDEKGKVPGLLYYVMKELVSKHDSVNMLPLQIYNGSVYNAFLGPEKGNMTEEDWHKQIYSFIEENSNNIKIPEFNYVDMLDSKVKHEEFPKEGFGTMSANSNEDPLNIHYPPVRDMLKKIISNAKNSIDEIKEVSQGKASLKVSSIEEIEQILDKKIKRPAVDTGMGLNEVSSRSHLFVIFQVGSRFITFADFGGIENMTAEPGSLLAKERKHLVDHDLVLFRKMVQQHTGSLIPSLFNKKNNEEQVMAKVISKSLAADQRLIYRGNYATKVRKDTITNGIVRDISVNLDSLQSSAMFNLLRGLSSIFSDNDCHNIIYLLFHKYANNWKNQNGKTNLENLCMTTNTVLKNTMGFKKG